MDAYPKRFQRTESSGRALSPTDSVISIGSFRPSLVWLFNHIRRQDQDALTKEDLRRLLDVDVDNVQLEEAFENLDTDRDGQISLDEFLAGFARFLREAPVTPGADKRKTFSVLLRRTHAQSGHAEPARPSAPSATGRAGGHRPSLRRRIIEEECFESVDGGGKMNGDNVEPSENFSRSLVILSSHNRQGIASLWKSLSESNPELLPDFEDFVGEIANEVDGAQRALDNQRRATKQEAIELDEEIESRLNAANTKMQIQTALVEVRSKLKLEQSLCEKESELAAVKQKLQELEGEVEEGHKAHTQLEQQFEMLSQEKHALQTRLAARDQVLQMKHEEMKRLHQQASKKVDLHSSHIEETQEVLTEMKREYEMEITELKEKIMSYEMNQSVTSDDELSMLSTQTPDLLSTMSDRHRRTSRNSLLDEIVKQEGVESPILRGEPLMMVTNECYSHMVRRTSSLPNFFSSGRLLEPLQQFPPPPLLQNRPPPQVSLQHELQNEATPTSIFMATLTTTLTASPTVDGHVTSHDLLPSLRISRSSTISGGQRPKIRSRSCRTGKASAGHVTSHGDHVTQAAVASGDHVTADNGHMTSVMTHATPAAGQVTLATSDATQAASQMTLRSKKKKSSGRHVTLRDSKSRSHDSPVTVIGDTSVSRMPQSPPSTARKEEEEEEEDEDEEEEQRDYVPLQFIENLATQPDFVFKILVVGNSYVGKSSFLMRLCTNAFSARYSSTIGVDFYSKSLKVDDRIISLQLWDTAGQERFQSVTKAYYRGAQGVVLMYDISQEESFIAVKSWINSIQENVDQMPLGMLLIGNKIDLEEVNEREVSTETGETFSKIYGAQFMETSAKTGYNVGNALMGLIRTIKFQCEHESSEKRDRGIQVANKPSKSRCCGSS